jgi:hypothetical protein
MNNIENLDAVIDLNFDDCSFMKKKKNLFVPIFWLAPKNPTLNCNEILPNLWLGELPEINYLEENNFEYVLTIIEKKYKYAYTLPKENQFWLEYDDSDLSILSNHFDECSKFIDNALSQNKKIYVHCFAGISRSPTIVIAYIMKYHLNLRTNFTDLYSYKLAKSIVIGKRDIIQPNNGFTKQLKFYEFKLKLDFLRQKMNNIDQKIVDDINQFSQSLYTDEENIVTGASVNADRKTDPFLSSMKEYEIISSLYAKMNKIFNDIA